MLRSAVAWVLPLLLALRSAAAAADGPKPDPVARIDAVAREYGYDRPDAPGMSLLVIKDGKVLFKKAYGLADVEAKVPNTTATNFRLASVTKQFTAMAVLILVERGKLRLDSRLTDLLPDFPAYGRDVTVRHLLGHTSGLPDAFDLAPAGRGEQLRDRDLLEILRRQTAGEFPPGSRYRYSNTGYVVLGLIVEKVSGEPFAAFLKRNIFDPLGMSGTVAYEPGGPAVPDRAYGHTPAGDGFRRTDQNRTSATLGDGGIYSSVEDLYWWDRRSTRRSSSARTR
jgi:CubicO group peptidase (beta-lactamase class C family)